MVAITPANATHLQYVNTILKTIADSAKVRGTGIAGRSKQYISEKIVAKNAVIALDDQKFVGFCYIELWNAGQNIVHSGLIVDPNYRGQGIAKRLKTFVFDYSRQKYPQATIFGITTSGAVMKINHQLGYRPVPFSQLNVEPTFWDGCKSCKNYDVLQRTKRTMCLCNAMIYKK